MDVTSDPANCGGCGVLCLSGNACVDGACACPGATRACGGECVGLDDPAHCGGCGVACAPGASCEGGACVCPDGGTICGERCERLDDDPAHCGGCDVQCPIGAACVDGTCACPAGQSACAGACVSTADDRAHCGGCGIACVGAQSCVAGECRCPGGRTLCGAACVDVSSDTGHCGACGVSCDAGAACVDGRCIPAYRWHDVEPSGGSMSVGVPDWDGRVAVSPDGHVTLAYSRPRGDVELVRYTPSGEVAWRRAFRTYATRVGGLAAADDGSVVLAATYEISWASPGRPTHDGVSGSDVAIVAIDASGTVRWERFVETDGADRAGAVALAPGRVVVSGSVSGTFDYGGGPLYADFFRDAFVLEMDEDGGYVDARVYGLRGTEEPVFVDVGPDGEVVLAGLSGAGVDFGGGPTSSVSEGFVAKLGPDYAHRWSIAVPAEEIHGVAVDASGTVYVTGTIDRTTNFGGDVSLTVPRFDQAAFLLALDGVTGVARWVRGIASSYVELGRGPVVDARGRLWWGATVDGSIGNHDAVLVAYDASGMRRFLRSYGSTGSDLVTGIAESGDTLAFAGRFRGSATFGDRIETSTDHDVFLLVLGL